MVAPEPDFIFNVTKLSGDQYYCEAMNVHSAEYSELAVLDVKCEIHYYRLFVLKSWTEHLQIANCPLCLSCSRDSAFVPLRQDFILDPMYLRQRNPLPALVWQMAREHINHSSDIPIMKVPLGSEGIRSLITWYHQDKDMLSLVCLSTNVLGSDRLVFYVYSSQTQQGRGVCRMLL